MQTAAATSSNISDTSTTYDHVRYPSHPFGETHPDLLATLGSLFGMNPARLESCRVLELGCGEGANLIPMAFQWPGSEFVGIDLSMEAIRYGNEFIAPAGPEEHPASLSRHHGDRQGLRKFRLHHCAWRLFMGAGSSARKDALDLPRKPAPQGIAYVSYNCYPGCHSRDIARQIMRYHVRDETDPQERARKAAPCCSFSRRQAPRIRSTASSCAISSTASMTSMTGCCSTTTCPTSRRHSISTRWSRPQPATGCNICRTRRSRCRISDGFRRRRARGFR